MRPAPFPPPTRPPSPAPPAPCPMVGCGGWLVGGWRFMDWVLRRLCEAVRVSSDEGTQHSVCASSDCVLPSVVCPSQARARWTLLSLPPPCTLAIVDCRYRSSDVNVSPARSATSTRPSLIATTCRRTLRCYLHVSDDSVRFLRSSAIGSWRQRIPSCNHSTSRQAPTLLVSCCMTLSPGVEEGW